MKQYNSAMQALIDQGKMPTAMQALPVTDKGFPVLWFASVVDGKPELRVADGRKLQIAWQHKRCWLCGGILGKYRTFVIGPMCTVNRVSSEPPSHHDCAHFAAIACPFLIKPAMVRNGKALPSDTINPAGLMIKRNPGVTAVWTTTEPRVMNVDGGYLFDIGEPTEVKWYCEARDATRAEIEASINSGLPAFHNQIKKEPNALRKSQAEAELEKMLRKAERYLPAA